MAHLQLAAGAVRLNHRGVLQLLNNRSADIGQVFLPQSVTLRQFGFGQAGSFCFMGQRIDARDFFSFPGVTFLSLYKKAGQNRCFCWPTMGIIAHPCAFCEYRAVLFAKKLYNKKVSVFAGVFPLLRRTMYFFKKTGDNP